MLHSAYSRTQHRIPITCGQRRTTTLLSRTSSSSGHTLHPLTQSAAALQHGCTRSVCRHVCNGISNSVQLCSLPTNRPGSMATRLRRCLQTSAAASPVGPGGYPRRSPEPRPPSRAAEEPQNLEQKRVKRSLWTVIDVLSLLGSVAGALAALLGWLSPTYALALPLVLPVVSLIAALQREDLQQEESAVVLSRLSSSLSQDAGGVLAEARSAMEEVRRELAAQAGATNRLASLEARLVAAEASAAAAAAGAREAAAGVAAIRGGLLQEVRGGQEMVGSVLRGELARGLAALAAEEAGAAARLDARLAAVEGCLSGLEASQAEGLRRLSLTLTSNLADAEALLQSSVRAEVALALEPVRRLPQMVAAMLPPPPPPAALPPASDLGPPAPGEGLPGVLSDQGSLQAPEQQQQQMALLLRQLVAEEVGAALAPLAAQQAEVLARLSSPRPAPLAEEQWDALGRRLGRLERLVEDLPPTTATAAAGQVAPLVASQQAALVEALEGLQQQAAAAAADQQRWQQELAQQGAQQQEVPAGRSQAAQQQQQQQQQQVLEEVLLELRGLGQNQAAAMSQLLQVDATQQQLAMASTAAAEAAAQQEARLQQQLARLQQQVDATSAGLQQLQGEVPVALAALQQAAASEGLGPGQSAAAAQATLEAVRAAAAGAAEAAAASSISEVASMLQQLGASTLSLTQQVAQLSAAVEQQASAVAAAAAAQQQVEGVLAAAGEVREEVTQAMSALQQQLPRELAGWEQQLAASAAAAVTDAAGVALTQALQQLLESGQLASLVSAAVQQQAEQQRAALASQPPPGAAAAGTAADMQLNGAGNTTEASGVWQYEQGWGADMAPQQQQQPQPALGSEVSLAAGSLLESQLGPAAWQAQPSQQDAAPTSAPTQTWGQPGQVDGPPAVGSSPPPGRQQQPQQQQQQQQRALDIDTLPRDQLFPAGLAWLRQGRDATRGTGPWAASGRDLAAGEVLLQGAVAAFQKALALTPGDARLLGNLGNALLAAGELKRAGRQEALIRGDAAAAEALRVEAVALLTSAGEQFRGVLEVEGWSSRALVNWGKALTGRAELAAERGAGRGEGGGAVKLYTAAITKFEAVLEEEPDNLVAKYRCGLALAGLAALTQPGRRAAELWGDAVNYLGDVASPAARAEPGLAAAAAEALRPAQDALELARLK